MECLQGYWQLQAAALVQASCPLSTIPRLYMAVLEGPAALRSCAHAALPLGVKIRYAVHRMLRIEIIQAVLKLKPFIAT